jgi:hypothetical protein
MVGRKHDAKGRSTNKPIGKIGRFTGPPKGEPWSWLTAAMLNSPAWRGMGANTHRLIDFLILEHCRHAGSENGNLMAPYRQLNDYGLSNRLIPEAIEEGEFLGLIQCKRGGYRTDNEASRYRLTWMGTGENPATNEWRAISEENIKLWRIGRQERRRKIRNEAKAKKIERAPKCDSAALPDVGAQNVFPIKSKT